MLMSVINNFEIAPAAVSPTGRSQVPIQESERRVIYDHLRIFQVQIGEGTLSNGPKNRSSEEKQKSGFVFTQSLSEEAEGFVRDCQSPITVYGWSNRNLFNRFYSNALSGKGTRTRFAWAWPARHLFASRS